MMQTKEKRKEGTICFYYDVVAKCQSVRTFQKNVWINLGNGLFIQQDFPHATRKTIQELYPFIRTCCYNNRIIAKRTKFGKELCFLKVPCPITRMK